MPLGGAQRDEGGVLYRSLAVDLIAYKPRDLAGDAERAGLKTIMDVWR